MTQRRIPTSATLDEMLLGTDDGEGWGDLVASPAAADAWEEARRRRADVDRVASWVRGRPWLARVVLATRRVSRLLGSAVQTPPSVQIGAPLAATLGAPARGVALTWDTIGSVTVRQGERLVFAPPEVGAFYIAADGAALRFDGTWIGDLSDGDVLVAVPASAVSSLDRAAAEGVPVAFAVVSVRNGESET